MRKRILAVLLCCAMLLGVLPIFAQASDVPASDSLGTVYLSISDDAKYVEGNDDAGTIMAYVPISLDEVAKIDLRLPLVSFETSPSSFHAVVVFMI